MNRAIGIVCLAWVTMMLIGACATAPPAVPVTPADTAKRYYLAKASEAEGKGNTVDALRYYKMALTVDPHDERVKASAADKEKALRDAARRHYEAGLKLKEEGSLNPARKEFLAALRLDPDLADAYKMLTDRSQVVARKYIVHVVKPGESISKLAQKYYGDHKKFPVIARFNGLEDAASIMAGQEIRIPVDEGFKEETASATVPARDIKEHYEVIESPEEDFFEVAVFSKAPVSESQPRKKEEEEQDQAKGYRDYALDLFQQQRYDEAAVEFEKVLAVLPDDKVAREYAYKANYESAVRLMNEKDYLAARERFKASLSYNSQCSACHTYIRECEDTYKEFHYRNGMKLFQDQNVQEALKEWELVSALDPNYKRTPQLIERAKTILKKLDELKRTK